MPYLNEIKKIHYSLYQLTPKTALNSKSQNKPRHGALLRIEFENIGVGYADCHPWNELGDQSLEDQLSLLTKNSFTPLAKKSIYFANIDAIYRSKNQSVLLNKISLNNHLISPYENISASEILRIKSLGVKFLKLKFGKNLKYEIEFIKNSYTILKENEIKLRLDFNSSMSLTESMQFFFEVQEKLDIIDFVEDPCEFNFKDWKKIQNTYPVNLALDRKTENEIEIIRRDADENSNSFSVIIIKPALEDINSYYLRPPKQRIIFTSYMDHPFGQVCAMNEAGNFYEKFPEKKEHCGFLTHSLYERNLYSDELRIEDTILRVNLGAGFGFEKLLQQENWISLC